MLGSQPALGAGVVVIVSTEKGRGYGRAERVAR